MVKGLYRKPRISLSDTNTESTSNKMPASPFRRLLHWGPLTVLGIIKLITWMMVHLHGMWWPPQQSLAASMHAALFLTLAAATLYYFLQALLEGPGHVPLGWRPEKEEDTQYLQFCTFCNGYKAPRSHHCSSCGYCVLKMDHHCMWINCCVGHANHSYFTCFLISAVLGCLQASVVLIICMYHAIFRVWYTYHGTGHEPMVHLTVVTLPLTLLAIGMALGVVLAVGALLYFQIKGILCNQTTIEEWIVEKADGRRAELGLARFVFPYDLGPGRNLRALFRTAGNGLTWPVRDGAGEYDLTREQIEQKIEKRQRSRPCRCAVGYSGRTLPVLAFPRAALAPPCSVESRLPMQEGDIVIVTRHRKHWLYGEKQVGGGDTRGPRGWFPRDCVTTMEKTKPE